MLTTQESPTIRCGQWAMTCVVDFKQKSVFSTLFVEDGGNLCFLLVKGYLYRYYYQ